MIGTSNIHDSLTNLTATSDELYELTERFIHCTGHDDDADCLACDFSRETFKLGVLVDSLTRTAYGLGIHHYRRAA